jgi:hypothetical protein
MSSRGFCSVCTCLALLAAASCGDSNSSPSPAAPSPSPPAPAPSTTFQGTIAGTTGQTGTLTVTIQSQIASASRSIFWPLVATLEAQSVGATGSVHVAGGSTTTLSGTYDPASRALNLSGGGFTFTGSASGAVVSGTYNAPSGVSGAFSTRSAANGTVTTYCGNFVAKNDPNEIRGVFNLVVSGSSVSGVMNMFADTPPTIASVTGQVIGTAISISWTATSGQYAGESGAATGTIQGGTVTLTGGSDGGTMTLSTSKCQ